MVTTPAIATNNNRIGVPDPILWSDIQLKAQLLKADPKNDALRTSILQSQVLLTSKQLNITPTEAGNVVRSYTSAYTYSQKQDPQAVLDALNDAQQQILNYDKHKPTLAGMDLVTANHMAFYFAASAGPVLGLAIIAFVVAILTIGPEAAAAVMAAGGVVEALTAVVGVATSSTGGTALAIGGFLFLISQFLGHFANAIPMITKQMVDNGTIAASLQITAIKNVAEVEAQLSGTKAPGPYSSAQFQSLLRGVQAAGITQVKNPQTGTVSPLTAKSLADLINVMYGRQIVNGAPLTPSKITPLLTQYFLKGALPVETGSFLGGTLVVSPVPQSYSTYAPAVPAAAPTSPAVSTPVAKVFTGVIADGVLGSVTSFAARPSDLITSINDLQNAAVNNLAPFISTLASRIEYEIKIVSSVSTSSGFTQTGTTQRVQSGLNSKGQPVYKTVTNRFAVMNLYIRTKTGTRAPLAQIVLGPTDAVQFHPSAAEFSSTLDFLKGEAHTSDLGSVTGLMTQQGAQSVLTPLSDTQIAQPMQSAVLVPIKPVTRDYYVERDGFYDSIFYRENGKIYQTVPGQTWQAELSNGTYANYAAQLAEVRRRLGVIGINVDSLRHDPFPFEINGAPAERVQLDLYTFFGAAQPAGSAAAPNTKLPAAALSSSSLYDFYTALGKTLPSLTDRSNLYESLGLGQASYYTGTAEQNTRLLTALKAQG